MRASAAIALAIALTGLGCRAAPQGSPRPHPHVFLIVIDTLRSDRLGAYGARTGLTPSIDRFARDAVVYRRAYAQSSWTKTSIASLLTGLHPYRHRVFTEKRQSDLPASATTVAERLRDLGYRTIAASMNPHVSKDSGFRQGFETFASQGLWEFGHNEEFTRAVIQQLSWTPRDRPLFLYMHYLDPHDPWHRHEACRDRLPGTGAGIDNPAVLGGRAFTLSGESAIEDLIESSETPQPVPLSSVEKEYLQALYDCEVSMVDAAVGELLAFLDKNRWLENALVVITADHGEEFWEHGMMRHGYQAFEETVRVPLIVRAPTSRELAGDPGDRIVELVDIPATIYDLVGIEPTAEDSAGTSLLGPAPGGGSSPIGAAFGVTRFRNRHQAYLVGDRQKVIYDFKEDRCRFYDLAADPGEEEPMDCETSEPGRRMLATLLAMKERQTRAALEPDAQTEASGEDDEVLKQRLRELGYVQ